MADITTKHIPLAPGDIPIKFKDLGDGTFAQYLALEPASIGGGSSGPASAVSIADGVTSTLKATVTAALALKVDGSGVTQPVSGTFWQATQPVSGPLTDTQLRASAVPVSGAFFQATQPVSLAAALDVSDRVARLLGHITVDNASLAVTGTFWQATQPVSGTFWQATQPVSGTFFQATQPVSLATNTPDVTDRAARLLGHVTVDNASLAVTGTFFQATQPVSAAALPLPTGAAIASLQSTLKAASTVAVATDTASVVQQTPQRADASTLCITALSTANASVTLTIPSAAGLFHYITSIEIVNINATITAIAAAATLLSYTTTNLPGSPVWNCGTLLAAGAEKVVTRFSPTTPIKSSAATTNTTIVAPAIGTGGQVRITVTYYTAP